MRLMLLFIFSDLFDSRRADIESPKNLVEIDITEIYIYPCIDILGMCLKPSRLCFHHIVDSHHTVTEADFGTNADSRQPSQD